MSRILFVSAVLGFSGLLSYFSLFHASDDSALRVPDAGTDLSSGVWYAPFSSGSISKAEQGQADAAGLSEGYLRVSPIAGVSFSGAAPEIVGQTVSIGDGLYFFRFGDIFQSFSVEHPDFRIKTLGHGNFYVDTRNSKSPKIFSVSALLTVDLLSKNETVTTAHIFPSTYFGYVPSYNTELKNADILRISTINTIRYVDLRDPKGGDVVLGKDSSALEFFQKNLAFEKSQAALFSKTYAETFRLSERIAKSDFSEEFGWYFVNAEKKAAILKGRLLRDLRNLAVSENCDDSNQCKNASAGISAIARTVSEMEGVDSELKSFASHAIRQAYYLSYYEPLSRGDAYFQSKTANAFVTAVAKTTPEVSVEYGDYALLSEIHAARYYGEKTSEQLGRYLNAYVHSLITGKAIRKSEFLPFSFFLKEYLSQEGFSINKTSLDLTLSLVNVSGEYYDTLASDDQRFSTLTVLYYTYSKIFDRIRKATASEFLEQREGAAYVKPEYLDDAGHPDLPLGFVDSFESLVKSFETSYAKKQRQLYASFLSKSPEKRVSDTSTLLDKALSGLKEQLSIFTDYPAYLQKISLDDASRRASGILFDAEYPNEEEVREYFSFFNGVEASFLRLKNDIKETGFYEVEVPIAGRNFRFELLPQEGYLIRNLTFFNGGELVETFRYTTVQLEEKKTEYAKLLSNMTPDNPRYQVYVFSNYFVNTYLSDRSAFAFSESTSLSDDGDLRPAMDPATLVFVEQNLIQKDFKNVVKGFPISIANIDAKISDKTWDINLSGIRKSVVGSGPTYVLEFSGKYLFEQHAFYRMSVKSLDSTTFAPQYGGASIQILPRNIPLSEIEKRTDSLHAFFTTLNSIVGSKIPSSVAINLSSRKLIVDGVEYDVPEN